jgi:osmoprotectant transport system permease protein
MAEGIRWDWIERHGDDIRTAVVQHVELVLISVAIAVVISVPVAVLVRRHRIPYALVIALGGVLYTIPSLAMFAFLVPSLGIGRNPVIVALVLYSFLILVRNTVVGLQGVPGPVLEAATGMGLTRWQTLRKVELPLALPSIIAGIRVATVSAVGIATIGALIAAGGLGDLIYLDGIARDFFLTPIVVGAVLAIALAIVLDLLLLGFEWALRPWARAKSAPA